MITVTADCMGCGNNNTHIDYEEAEKLFTYNRDTGVLTWRVRVNQKVKANSIAGCRNVYGYRVVTYKGRQYKEHHIIWLLTNGEWPKMLDHINGVKWDNRLENLRESTTQENSWNQRVAQSNNSTGFLGVSWHKGHKKFISHISVNMKLKHIGYFDTAEEAHEAYLKQKRILHSTCTI